MRSGCSKACRFAQRVAQLDVELVVVDVVQEHVHPCQVVGGVVDFLTVEPVFDDVFVELLLGLQQQRAGAAGRIVDFVDAGLLVHGQPRDQLGDVLRGKELATGLAGVGGVVGDKKLVGVAEQVNVAGVESTEVEFGHAFEHGGQAGVFLFDCVAETVAGGVEVGEQTLDVVLGRVAAGRAFDGGEDAGQVGIQGFVAMGTAGHVGEQLAGIDEVALGLDSIVLDVRGDDAVSQLGVLDAVVAALDVAGKVLADEAVEQGAEDVLLEVPAIDRASNIVSDLPNSALQFGALLGVCHWGIPGSYVLYGYSTVSG